MTQKHHEDCPYHDDFQGINNVSECYCGVVIGDDDMCVCDCMCEELIKAGEVARKLAAIDRRENEEAWREQAPKLGIHPDMFVKKSEREALGFFEEDRFV